MHHSVEENSPEKYPGSDAEVSPAGPQADFAHTPTDTLPFVSVIMPVRNEARCIRKAVLAVLSQTYPKDRMELIVADGISSDMTKAVVGSIATGRPEVILIENPGRTAASGLNAAIRIAKGEIIIRVDGHCIIHPDYVEHCVRHLSEGSADCVGGSVTTTGETRVAKAIAAAMGTSFGVGNSTFRTKKNVTCLVDTVPFPAYPRSVLQRCGPYDEELIRNQDDEYNARLRKLGGRILLAADVKSDYYSRASIRSLWNQYFEYGYYKVRVIRKHFRQASFRHFVPALFVFVLLLTGILGAFHPLFVMVFGSFLAMYLAFNCVGALLTARVQGWDLLPILPVCFGTLHFAYGFGVLAGFTHYIVESLRHSLALHTPSHA